MPVISLIVTQSASETISGIPDTITVSTNIPAIIFYTLDGTIPDTNSAVYFAPIHLPTYLAEVILTILASDGSDTSATFIQTYTADLSSISNLTQGARFP